MRKCVNFIKEDAIQVVRCEKRLDDLRSEEVACGRLAEIINSFSAVVPTWTRAACATSECSSVIKTRPESGVTSFIKALLGFVPDLGSTKHHIAEEQWL